MTANACRTNDNKANDATARAFALDDSEKKSPDALLASSCSGLLDPIVTTVWSPLDASQECFPALHKTKTTNNNAKNVLIMMQGVGLKTIRSICLYLYWNSNQALMIVVETTHGRKYRFISLEP